MKVLVTGGSGYLGTFVRKFFSADDFSRRSGFDVRDEDVVKTVADYDAVIHLAAHFDKSPDGARECFRKVVLLLLRCDQFQQGDAAALQMLTDRGE